MVERKAVLETREERQGRRPATRRLMRTASLAALLSAAAPIGVAAQVPEFDFSPTGNVEVGSPTTDEGTGITTLEIDLVSGDVGEANWDTFSVGADTVINVNYLGEAVDASEAILLNRVFFGEGGVASVIDGTINSDVQFWLINPSGILVGESGVFNVPAFLATTANVAQLVDESGSGPLQFIGSPSFGSGNIDFQGTINIDNAGPGASYAIMAAANIGFSGTIAETFSGGALTLAQMSKVVFEGQESFSVSVSGIDGVSFATDPDFLSTLPSIVSISGGTISTTGAVILSTAAMDSLLDRSVNIDGVIEAGSITIDSAGSIVLGGDGSTRLEADVVDFSGDDISGDSFEVIASEVTISPSSDRGITLTDFSEFGETSDLIITQSFIDALSAETIIFDNVPLDPFSFSNPGLYIEGDISFGVNNEAQAFVEFYTGTVEQAFGGDFLSSLTAPDLYIDANGDIQLANGPNQIDVFSAYARGEIRLQNDGFLTLGPVETDFPEILVSFSVLESLPAEAESSIYIETTGDLDVLGDITSVGAVALYAEGDVFLDSAISAAAPFTSSDELRTSVLVVSDFGEVNATSDASITPGGVGEGANRFVIYAGSDPGSDLEVFVDGPSFADEIFTGVFDTETYSFESSGNLIVYREELILIFRAVDLDREYGLPNPELEWEVIGEVDPDVIDVLTGAPSLTVSADISSNVGTYVIDIEPGTLDLSELALSYEIVFEDGILTINPAPLVLSPGMAMRIYGDENTFEDAGIEVVGGELRNGDSLGEIVDFDTLGYFTDAIQSSDVLPDGAYDLFFDEGFNLVGAGEEGFVLNYDITLVAGD